MDEFLQLPNDPPVVLDVDSDPWANPNFDSFYNDQTYPDTYVADVFASTPAPGTPGLSIGSPLKPLTNEGHTHSERNDSSMQPRHPLASSSSPESSSQESSSESSGRGRKRKSSSLSNPYELLNDMDSPNMTNGVGKSKLGLPSGRVHRGGSPLIPTRADQDLERIGQRLEHDFAFSNHNSPGTGVEQMTIAPAQLEFIQNRVAPSPPAKRSDWIIGDSRDGSPSMTISNEGSPSAPFDPTSPTFASPGFGNAVTSFSTPSGNNPAWQQSNFNLGVSPSPAQNSYFSRPSSARRPSGSDFKTMFRAVPSQWKSRVETQIIMTLYAYPLPPEVQKLHLPTVSISKPKFLAKDIIKSPDTLELHTSLVCASAMRNAETRRMAMLRAQGVSIKSEGSTSPMEDVDDGSSNDNDPDKPLNGGEVHICENCMAREHKRATRKRTKQQDGEETWFQYAKDRIIIFNEKEYQEWKPADPKDTVMGEQLPEGTMKISVPTRIACYCRHQQEKIGFQIIFTLKDYKGNVITQTITDAITITDDHKTNGNNHPMQEPAATQPAPGLQRPYHSANDLQALQQSSQLQFHHHHPPAFAQRPDAFSQSTSATMTPHSYQSLSRQASPSAQAGPNKRRKGSGSHHHRLPSNLTMTRLDTSQQAIGMQGLSSAGSNHGLVGGAFTPVSASFMQPADLMAAISMPANPASPPTPSTAGAPLTPGLPMRNQSGDNLASFYSLPNSAQASRSGSPVGGMRTGHSMAAFQQQLPQNPFANQYGGSHSAIDLQSQVRQQPVVYKVLPNEGPLSGGKEVTCLGSGFTRTTEVFFGGIAAVPVTYWAPSALVCLTPPGAKPGAVPVTVRDTSNGAMSNAQSHTTSAVFTYTDDGEKQLLELVLRVIGDKHQGNPEGFKSFLMNIVESSNGGWAPGAGGSHSGYRHNQRGIFDAGGEREMDTEDILMKCLDVIDMDESPYAPQYNMRMDNGETMLSLACSLGFTRFVAALLARGADPETRDRNGFTPLMKAALHGHANLVRRLLLKGADPTLRSLKGYLAVDLATTDEVAEVLRRLPHRRRTRSGGDERVRSRANSLVSLHSVWDTPSPSLLSRRSSRVESPEADVDSDDSDVVQAPIPTQVWIQSRRNSTVLDSHALVTPLPEDQNRFLSPAAATAAMAAWGNHLAAQIQQFQQNVNWNFPNFQLPALPPMPQLPGYQAHPMMRRISSLVPHRTPSRNANPAVEATDAPQDSSWRDLFSSSPALPPAYEEIYPEGGSDEQTDLKKSSALEAAADTLLDRKCSELFDRQSTRASSSTAAALRTVTEDSDTDLDVRIGNGIVTKEAQEKMKRAHAKKLKKIRSDRNLWMIWIPLLLVLLGMMLKNRIFDMVAIGARYFPGSQQAAPLQRIVEIA